MDEESAAQVRERLPIYSDCSGKHAGMLAACHAQGWDPGTYPSPDHRLQRRVLGAVAKASGQEPQQVGIDGCGVPVHAMPLRAMATIYARLAVTERLGDLEPFAVRAVGAMRAEPYLVAGRNRPDTGVMEVVPGVMAKGGAEGLMCAALLDQGLGLAVKVRDGGARASGPALIHALRGLGLVDDGRLARLEPFARPAVLGGGKPVGNLLPVFSLATV